MENMILIGVAVVSGVLCYKQELLHTWIFFVNLIFSIYIALFAAPVIAELIPEFSSDVDVCKLPAAMILLTVLITFCLYQLTDSISLRTHDKYPIPELAGKIGAMIFGGLSGVLLLSFVCICIFMMPFSETFPINNREALSETSKKTLRIAVKTLDFLSMQGMNHEQEDAFKRLTAFKSEK